MRQRIPPSPKGIDPDALALHTLLKALTAASEWERAIALFEGASAAGVAAAASASVTAAAIEACAAGASANAASDAELARQLARRASEYIERLGAQRLVPSAACYRGAIQACAAASEASAAMALWQAMVRIDMVADAQTYGALVRALHTAGRHDEENLVLGHAERAGVPTESL